MKKFSIILLQVLQFFFSAENQTSALNELKVTIECSQVKTISYDEIHKFQTCESVRPDLIVTDFRVEVTVVLNAKNKNYYTTPIEAFSITNASNLKFLPSAIKTNFPSLRAFDVEDCGLIHIDRHDMRELGTDILFIRFKNTKLYALEGNLFENNQKLKKVIFEKSPLNYIDPQLFENLKRIKSLNLVEFIKCHCVKYKNVTSDFVVTFKKPIDDSNWDAHSCSDHSTQLRYILQIQRRETFLIEKKINERFEKIENLLMPGEQYTEIGKTLNSATRNLKAFHSLKDDKNNRDQPLQSNPHQTVDTNCNWQILLNLNDLNAAVSLCSILTLIVIIVANIITMCCITARFQKSQIVASNDQCENNQKFNKLHSSSNKPEAAFKAIDPIYEEEYDSNGKLVGQKTLAVNGHNMSEDLNDLYESIDLKVVNSTKPSNKTDFQDLYASVNKPLKTGPNNQFNPQELYATFDKQDVSNLNESENLKKFQELYEVVNKNN